MQQCDDRKIDDYSYGFYNENKLLPMRRGSGVRIMTNNLERINHSRNAVMEQCAIPSVPVRLYRHDIMNLNVHMSPHVG